MPRRIEPDDYWSPGQPIEGADMEEHDPVEDAVERGDIVERRRRPFTLVYPAGVEMTVQAHDAAEAVRLVGRGQPDEIRDLDVWGTPS